MDLKVIKRKLLERLPYFGQVIQNVRFREYKCKTACTDGLSVMYNPEFIDKLDEDEQLFVFAHELLHVAYNHIYRSENKNNKLWNIATDAVINQQLKRDCKLPLFEGLVDIPEAYDLGALEMYKKLEKEKNEFEENSKGSGSGSGIGSADDYGDIENHDCWDEPGEISKELDEEDRKKLKDAIDKIKDDKDAAKKNKELKDKLAKEFKDRQNQRKKGAGAATSGIKLKNQTLGVTHEVPWQTLLDDLVGSKGYYDYTQPKQVRYGIIDDSWRILPSIKVEIIIDVSGSVSEDLVRNFLMECKGIFDAAESKLEMKIGFFDQNFYAPKDDGTYTDKIGNDTKSIDSASDIDKLDIPGGGGTNFYVALSGFGDLYSNKIIFTDGYDDWQNLPPMDVIWIVYGEEPPIINPPGAKGVIYVKGKQFDDLNKAHIITEEKGMTR